MVFEAVGVPGMIDDVVFAVPPLTRIVVAGVCMQPDTIRPLLAVVKELNLQFVYAYDPTEFSDTLRAIAEGDVDVAPFVTGAVGFDGVAGAFAALERADEHVKVLVEPDGPGETERVAAAMSGARMAGKVALVTGSTRGIGRAIAMRFAAEGAKVVVTGRTEETGREVEAEIRAAGGDATYVRTDLANEDEVVAAVSAAVTTYGRLTTLVNNAAPTELMGPGRMDRRVTELENDAWDSIMLVALKAVVWACKHAIPEMAKAGADAGSSIVNISSAASMLGTPGLDTYTAAKGALNTLTRSMAVEYAGDGIRSNCIVSGMVLTSEGAHTLMEDPVIGGATRAMHLTRLGLPEDIANAALFLASDEAAFVTGAVIPVDGGVTARMPVPDLSAADVQLD